jgi:transposase
MARNSRLSRDHETKDVGRPSKFTPEIREAIIDAISHRIPYEYAAEANGIAEVTLYDWINTGKAHMAEGIDSEYVKFSQDIKRAEMTKMRTHMDIIAERPERWQADAWILERRWHKQFGPNAAIQELNNRLARLENGDQGNESEKRDAKERNEKDD